jgi:hypothetical protein
MAGMTMRSAWYSFASSSTAALAQHGADVAGIGVAFARDDGERRDGEWKYWAAASGFVVATAGRESEIFYPGAPTRCRAATSSATPTGRRNEAQLRPERNLARSQP